MQHSLMKMDSNRKSGRTIKLSMTTPTTERMWHKHNPLKLLETHLWDRNTPKRQDLGKC